MHAAPLAADMHAVRRVDGEEDDMDDEIVRALATLQHSISEAHVQARAAVLVPG